MQSQNFKIMAPCRPSHGDYIEQGSAYHSAARAVGREKWATARRVGSSSTSQPPETSYGTGEEMVRLRVGTANIGSMSGRSGEVIDTVQRRGLFGHLERKDTSVCVSTVEIWRLLVAEAKVDP